VQNGVKFAKKRKLLDFLKNVQFSIPSPPVFDNLYGMVGWSMCLACALALVSALWHG
jgi:hypothetical protein